MRPGGEYEPILERIRRLSRERGWTAHRLAVESGVTRSIVYRVLRGEGDTTTARAEAMLRVLLQQGDGDG